MIEDCLKKDPSIAFEELDLNGRKLLNYVALCVMMMSVPY